MRDLEAVEVSGTRMVALMVRKAFAKMFEVQRPSEQTSSLLA